jgi:hypothetical protein
MGVEQVIYDPGENPKPKNLSKVYIVMLDLGYDGIHIESVFSSKGLAIKYIEEKYPEATYNEEVEEWTRYSQTDLFEKPIWDGCFFISVWNVDE